MMSAAALLAKTPKPTDQDIDSAMNGNLCRCGTYLRIRQAIHRAAAIAATRAVLYIAADGRVASQLALNEEFRAIQHMIRASSHRDTFEVTVHAATAVRRPVRSWSGRSDGIGVP